MNSTKSTGTKDLVLTARTVDEDITLIPYYPNEAVTLEWYQDRELCRQVDNIDGVYSLERLQAMYTFLTTHGACYYIDYGGKLVGDVTLRDNGEIAIVICKSFQNRHIGYRCIHAMIDLAREKGLPRITANIYAFNEQSRRAFLKAGFVQTDDEWFEYVL